MPYKRRRYGYKRKIYRKRRIYKRRRTRPRRRRMSYTISRTIATPDTQYVKLAYNEIIVRNPGAVTDSYVWRMNSINDPNLTGAGLQFTGLDQYAALFQRYQVLAASINVTFMNRNAAETALMVIYPSSVATVLPYSDGISQPYARKSIIGGTNAISAKSLTSFMRIKKLMGRTTVDDNFTALVTGNPNKNFYWVTAFVAADLTTNLLYSMSVKLVAYVKFYERQPIVDV